MQGQKQPHILRSAQEIPGGNDRKKSKSKDKGKSKNKSNSKGKSKSKSKGKGKSRFPEGMTKEKQEQKQRQRQGLTRGPAERFLPALVRGRGWGRGSGEGGTLRLGRPATALRSVESVGSMGRFAGASVGFALPCFEIETVLPLCRSDLPDEEAVWG